MNKARTNDGGSTSGGGSISVGTDTSTLGLLPSPTSARSPNASNIDQSEAMRDNISMEPPVNTDITMIAPPKTPPAEIPSGWRGTLLRWQQIAYEKITPDPGVPLPKSYETPIWPSGVLWLQRQRAKGRRGVVLGVFLAVSAVILALLYFFSGYSSYGGHTGQGPPQDLNCDHYYWGGNCGLYGVNCRPFNSSKWEPIRCPSGCAWKDPNLWKVIGTGNYRADSRICKSAVHAGVLSNTWGGCFLLRLTGFQPEFTGSTANGVTSESRNYSFLRSYELKEATGVYGCVNLKWPIFGTTLALLLCLCLLAPPRSLLYFLLLNNGYWYCVLVGQPTNYLSSIQQALANWLPFHAVALVMYRLCRPGMVDPVHVFDVYLLYVVPAWLLVNMNIISNFVDFDLGSQGVRSSLSVGTIVGIVIIGLIGLVAAVLLLRIVYLHGHMPRTLKYYAAGALFLGLVTLIASKDFSLHIHHYQIALILWPLTRYHYRICAVAQGAALGMFINGVAVWGMDSLWTVKGSEGGIRDTPPDAFIVPNTTTRNSVTVAWENITEGMDPVFSLFMNDYEVWRSEGTNTTVEGLTPNTSYAFCVRYVYSGDLGRCSEYANATTLPY